MITKFKIFEGIDEDEYFYEILQKTIDKYKLIYNCSIKELNDGFCYDLAEEVVKKIGRSKDLFTLNTAKFSSDYPVDMIEALFKHEINWSKEMLNKWGKPPMNIKKWHPGEHEWIVYKGRHYDAEAPNGVDKWYDLPIIQRYIEKFHKKLNEAENMNEIDPYGEEDWDGELKSYAYYKDLLENGRNDNEIREIFKNIKNNEMIDPVMLFDLASYARKLLSNKSSSDGKKFYDN